MIEEIRKAIRNDGRSTYRLAQDSGVSQAQLSRFVNDKRSLSLTAAEKLVNALGLRLVGGKKRRPAN